MRFQHDTSTACIWKPFEKVSAAKTTLEMISYRACTRDVKGSGYCLHISPKLETQMCVIDCVPLLGAEIEVVRTGSPSPWAAIPPSWV